MYNEISWQYSKKQKLIKFGRMLLKSFELITGINVERIAEIIPRGFMSVISEGKQE